MKRLTVVLLSIAACGLITGCASSFPRGTFYTDLKLPVAATDNAAATKVGTACCTSYFGLVTMGDASIDAAKKNGNISKVSHVDWEANNILGIYGKYQVKVYGE